MSLLKGLILISGVNHPGLGESPQFGGGREKRVMVTRIMSRGRGVRATYSGLSASALAMNSCSETSSGSC